MQAVEIWQKFLFWFLVLFPGKVQKHATFNLAFTLSVESYLTEYSQIFRRNLGMLIKWDSSHWFQEGLILNLANFLKKNKTYCEKILCLVIAYRWNVGQFYYLVNCCLNTGINFVKNWVRKGVGFNPEFGGMLSNNTDTLLFKIAISIGNWKMENVLIWITISSAGKCVNPAVMLVGMKEREQAHRVKADLLPTSAGTSDFPLLLSLQIFHSQRYLHCTTDLLSHPVGTGQLTGVHPHCLPLQ